MEHRREVSYNGAKRLFTATADRTHPYNLNPKIMRGGFRI